jgi:hypothetical protein
MNMGRFALEYAPDHAWTEAQKFVRWLHDAGLSDKMIATVVNCHVVTVNRIRNGRVSGRNLEPRLWELYTLMRKYHETRR